MSASSLAPRVPRDHEEGDSAAAHLLWQGTARRCRSVRQALLRAPAHDDLGGGEDRANACALSSAAAKQSLNLHALLMAWTCLWLASMRCQRA